MWILSPNALQPLSRAALCVGGMPGLEVLLTFPHQQQPYRCSWTPHVVTVCHYLGCTYAGTAIFP